MDYIVEGESFLRHEDRVKQMLTQTACVRSISPSEEYTWEGKWFVTLDVDWAHDDVLGYAIDLVEEAGISATWLITHETKLLDRLASNPLFELGLHPNFNGLLSGGAGDSGGARRIVGELLEIVPGARSVRSHSLAYSSRLSEIFVGFGLSHDLNSYIPRESVDRLSPWYLPNSQIRIPFVWEDDAEFPIDSSPNWSQWRGLRVLNFHPIHLFLNTENSARYESTRDIHTNPTELVRSRNRGYGTRSIFDCLVGFLAKRNLVGPDEDLAPRPTAVEAFSPGQFPETYTKRETGF